MDKNGHEILKNLTEWTKTDEKKLKKRQQNEKKGKKRQFVKIRNQNGVALMSK